MIYNVLIVDDEIEIRTGLLSFSWNKLGFEAIGALSDGEEALAFILANPVDVVLCDIQMPNMNGLEFAREVSKRKLPVKIVLLTGFKDMELIRSAMRYGCRDYLLKPTRFKQLEEVFSQIKQELDVAWEDHLAMDEDDPIMQTAKKFIQGRLESVTLESLANYLHLSPAYLSRVFKENTGMNFSEYCQSERMNLAKLLLNDPRNQIQEIALQTGYSNSTNFSRAFRVHFNISPTEYRESVSNKK